MKPWREGRRGSIVRRAFPREATPLFPEIAREFVDFLQARAGQSDCDPPFLAELAHYEWVELALQISEATVDDLGREPLGDPGSSPGQALLDGVPVLSPLAWPSWISPNRP